MPVNVDLEKLLEVGAHFGHQVKRWNPKMAPFIYGQKQGVHIFDLIKTREALIQTLKMVEEVSKEGKVILFVGTKKQAKDKVKQVAQECGCPYVSERWLGGTFTNFDQIQKSIRDLKALQEKIESGEFKNYTKKEKLLIGRKIERQKRFLGGIVELTKLPDLMIVVDVRKERTAVREAAKVGVKTVGIVDTNVDPSLVDWPVPMNDDANKAIEYVLDLFGQAILAGKKARKKKK